MNFNYDLTENYFKYINLYMGVEFQKNKIKKHPVKKVLTATKYGLQLIGCTLLCIICQIITTYQNIQPLTNIISYCSAITLLLTIVYYLLILLNYLTSKYTTKKVQPKGTIYVTKEGIEDKYEDNTTIKLPWDQIDFILIINNTLLVLTKANQFSIIANITTEKEKFIKTCENYNKNIQIIEQRMK